MKLSIDKRRQRKDGTYPIVLRITYKSKSRDINTGLTCKLFQWDSRYNTIKELDKETQILSDRLKELRFKYQEKLLEFERNLLEPTTDIQTIKNYLTGKLTRHSTVLELWDDEINRLKVSNRHGNARNYRSAKLGIQKVMRLKIPFSAIDYSWLSELDSKLRANGLKQNSVAVYMRTLRALYNKAINLGVADAQEYPFRRYKIKSESRSPRVASIEELKQFFAFNLHESCHSYDHWNYGRLIFLLRGINFTDLALLTRESIKHNRIVYTRNKTHKVYSVKLLPLAKRIIRYYDDPDRETLLPIITNEELQAKEKLPQRIGQLRKTTNKWLKEIVKR